MNFSANKLQMKSEKSKLRILYVATSDIHINTFHLPYLKWLKGNGYAVDIAVENRANILIPFVDKIFYLPFPRTPLDLTNYKSYKKLKAIIEINKYDLVHCHTPIPSVLARLAARSSRKNGTKVLYTAHGFHFYNGGPIKNWLTYYPVEWLLSGFTDGIVTINAEDFGHINGKMRHKESFYIKGIGIDTAKFQTLSEIERYKYRQNLGFKKNDFILLYVAEFIYRKNHKFVIDALPELRSKIPDIKILFAGKGILLEKMKTYADQLGVADNIDFLGFRSDLGYLAGIADLGISSSRQEGLGLGLAEEMLCSVPVVATVDRGHKEMIIHGKNGFLFEQENRSQFIEFIFKLYSDPNLRSEMGASSFERAQLFRIENSLESMSSIYNKYLGKGEEV